MNHGLNRCQCVQVKLNRNIPQQNPALTKISIDLSAYNDFKWEVDAFNVGQQKLCNSLELLAERWETYKKEANKGEIEGECMISSAESADTIVFAVTNSKDPQTKIAAGRKDVFLEPSDKDVPIVSFTSKLSTYSQLLLMHICSRQTNAVQPESPFRPIYSGHLMRKAQKHLV